MGWDGYWDRRKYVAEQKAKTWTSNGNSVSVRKHHAHGEQDWFILDVKDSNGTLVESFITLIVWDGGMKKNMDEACGPYYYGCPIEWLDEVPAPESAYNWRERRRKIEESYSVQVEEVTGGALNVWV